MLDKYQKEVVNISVKYARDIVKSRKHGNTPPKAPLLMVHGGAGAGKSTVIKVVAQWTQKIIQKEGDDADCPCVIKTAFTGTAASNIEGQTLHASFGFAFDNKHYSLTDKSRDQKRASMKNLKIVIIDEISMVKSDMLYQLDLRLQEIKEKNGVPFGGVAIIAFGDMMQLKPCMGRYICDEPINKEFKITHALSPRWKMFESLTLEVNHRQGNDKQYADLLNRIRIGAHTEEDVALLRTRVRSENHPDLQEAGLYIVCKRKECAKLNLKYLNSIEAELITVNAIHHHSTQKTFKPFIEPKEGAVASTSFMNELKLKVGAKVMLIHNIDTVDCLTNGQLGVLVDIIKTTSGQVDKLIIKLQNKGAGKQNRQDHPALAAKYPNCVIIERASIQYTLHKKGGDVGTTAMVIQFPIKLAFAITSHKIQGQTIPWPMKVVLDIESVFEDAQAHVMLSRVQRIEQIYIVGKLNENKIRTSQLALSELKRLENISMNKNPSPWHEKSKKTIKVMSLNCAGLKSHYKDIEADPKIANGDMIHLIETSLEEPEENPLKLSRYGIHTKSNGKGKGIASYYNVHVFQHQSDFIEQNIQVTKFSSEELDVINVYRSSKGDPVKVLDRLIGMLHPEKATLITGDFNICSLKNPNNTISKGLKNKGFDQIMREPTHIRGGHIDHVYWKAGTNKWKDPILERYSPYYSDHDASCITMIKQDQ